MHSRGGKYFTDTADRNQIRSWEVTARALNFEEVGGCADVVAAVVRPFNGSESLLCSLPGHAKGTPDFIPRGTYGAGCPSLGRDTQVQGCAAVAEFGEDFEGFDFGYRHGVKFS